MSDIQTEERTPVEQAKGAAADVAGQAADKAGTIVEQTKGEAKQVAASAGEHLQGVIGSARSELRDRAKSEAGTLGDSLSKIAEELRAMGQASSENGGMTAGFVGTLADQVDRGAERLSSGDLEQAMEDAKRFARNRPGAFLLGAAGAGFLIGRLLRSADLKELGEAVKPGGNEQDDGALGAIGAQPAITPASPLGATAPPTSSPTPPSGGTPPPRNVPAPNPGSTPLAGGPTAPGATS